MKLEHDGFTYSVEPEWIVIDESFSHEFGIHRQYRREVDALNIFEKKNDLGEDVPIEVGEDIKLIKVVEDILNNRLGGC